MMDKDKYFPRHVIDLLRKRLVNLGNEFVMTKTTAQLTCGTAVLSYFVKSYLFCKIILILSFDVISVLYLYFIRSLIKM